MLQIAVEKVAFQANASLLQPISPCCFIRLFFLQ